eukprot:GHUV01037540.1.p1 GENE.GHUV01037540.1~~GHUV01037540.1.p1  ORF type:complete len:137 (-),score=15.52 GHUV01037540.1:171-581(-)
MSGVTPGKSILLSTGTISKSFSNASHTLASVCASTPWLASTTSRAPSQDDRLRDTWTTRKRQCIICGILLIDFLTRSTGYKWHSRHVSCSDSCGRLPLTCEGPTTRGAKQPQQSPRTSPAALQRRCLKTTAACWPL